MGSVLCRKLDFSVPDFGRNTLHPGIPTIKIHSVQHLIGHTYVRTYTHTHTHAHIPNSLQHLIWLVCQCKVLLKGLVVVLEGDKV